jgi:hypothetical protein
MTKKKSNEPIALSRLIDAAQITANDIFQIFQSNSKFNFEQIFHNEVPIIFNLDLDGINLSQDNWTTPQEARLAVAIYEALIPARQVSLEYLIDPGIWSWIALHLLKDYVVNRWCGGYARAGLPVKADACSYFLTGNSSQKQTRCAPRRLFIAAETSWKVEGNFSKVEDLLGNTDLYSAIFERQLGNDLELAIEISSIFGQSKREVYRPGIKLVGILLSTVAIEYLDRQSKRELVLEAFEATRSKLVM